MAAWLASVEDPYKRLCPHPLFPRREPHDFAFPAYRALNRAIGRRKELPPQTHLEYLIRRTPERTAEPVSVPEGEVASPSRPQFEEKKRSDSSKLSEHRKPYPHRETQLLVDFKSFSQSLFNTTAWDLASIFECQNGIYRVIPARNLKSKETTTDIHKDTADTSLVDIVNQETTLAATAVKDQSRSDIGTSSSLQTLHIWHGEVLYRITTCGTHRALISRTTLEILDSALVRSLQTSTCFMLKNEGNERLGFARFGRTSSPDLPHSKFVYRDTSHPTVCHDFAIRSIDHILSSPKALVRSFLNGVGNDMNKPDTSPRTDSIHKIKEAFRRLLRLNNHPCIIFTALGKSITDAHLHTNTMLDKLQASSKSTPEGFDDAEAAHIVNLSLGALIASVPSANNRPANDAWSLFLSLKRAGCFVPNPTLHSLSVRQHVLKFMEAYEHELATRLMRMTLTTFASRSFRINPSLLQGQENHSLPVTWRSNAVFTDNILRFLAPDADSSQDTHVELVPYSHIVLEWARTIIHQEWDSKAEFSWGSHFGSAIEFIRVLCMYLCSYGITLPTRC